MADLEVFWPVLGEIGEREIQENHPGFVWMLLNKKVINHIETTT